MLEALSRRRTSTLTLLASETGLPRPTVVRLLHTLAALGYAQRVSRDQGWRLTDRVLGLSESIRFVDHLVDAAMPHMSRFTADHGWPLYLATLSSGAITIRHSTAPESPMAFEAAALNTRRSVLPSALGRVWLAFSGAEERRGGEPVRSPAGAGRTSDRARRCRQTRLACGFRQKAASRSLATVDGYIIASSLGYVRARASLNERQRLRRRSGPPTIRHTRRGSSHGP